MKDKRQIKLVGLVLASLLLLLCFLAFWNLDNYRKEHRELEQDLKDQMSLACSEYRDSLVQDIFRIVDIKGEDRIKRFDGLKHIDKMAQDSIHDRFTNFFKTDSAFKFPDINEASEIQQFELHHDEKDNGIELPKQLKETRIVTIIEAEGSTNSKPYKFPDPPSDSEIVVWTSDETGKHRLEYKKNLTKDSTGIWNNGLSISSNDKGNFPSTKIPTVFNIIDSIFSNRLLENGINLPHERKIIEGKGKTINGKIVIPFEYDSFGFHEIPSAVFSNYNSFLLRRIAPSIVMSILLFALLAITFFTILKSWAKQRRLTLLKNEFVSNMTHELNTPIATIGVALEALENYGAIDDPIRRKEYLDISKHEVGRLKSLVDKVLSISSSDAAQEALTLTTFDFKQLVDDKIESMKLHLDKHNANVQINTIGSEFNIQADKIHLNNVLQNLIDNAIKYSNQDPQIDITVESKSDQLRITIADQGMGIPKIYYTKVFDRFFRVPQNDRHDVKGHGLGLHYVKSVINQHKGTIQLLPSENGSTFLIQLPK